MKAIFLQKLAHEFQRGALVPFRLDQHIEVLGVAPLTSSGEFAAPPFTFIHGSVMSKENLSARRRSGNPAEVLKD